jgi:hypothetical protein
VPREFGDGNDRERGERQIGGHDRRSRPADSDVEPRLITCTHETESERPEQQREPRRAQLGPQSHVPDIRHAALR